jgi:hypothetical protein
VILSDTFPFPSGLKKKENSLLSPLFSFASEYVIMKFQEEKERLKLTWTHHLPVQAGDSFYWTKTQVQ